MLLASILFMLNPEIFLRNVFSKENTVRIIGIVICIYSSCLIFSFVNLLSRKYAVCITDEFLIDNSKYESIGKIKWSDILKIQRLKKRNIKITINETRFKSEMNNPIKRFLRFMHNWDYKNSVLISSALLDCSIQELTENISTALQKNNANSI